MPSPSARKSAYNKGKNPHRGGVACALFVKLRDESKARATGKDTVSSPKSSWENHAEPQWWGDASNVAALSKAAKLPNVETIEFEVSTDFCSERCRNLFQQARRCAPHATIYIFIMREEKVYQVHPESGSVDFVSKWS
jgi:hypothetical protein